MRIKRNTIVCTPKRTEEIPKINNYRTSKTGLSQKAVPFLREGVKILNEKSFKSIIRY